MDQIDAYKYIFQCRDYKVFPSTMNRLLAKKIMEQKAWELELRMCHIMDEIQIIHMQNFLNRLPRYLTYWETKKLEQAKKIFK